MLDLRISGRKALVCAASKGLGRACAMSLGRAGVELTITARTAATPSTITMPIFTGSKLFKGLAAVEGRGKVETPLGERNAVRVRLRTEFSGKLNARELRIWFSDDAAHVRQCSFIV